MVLDDNRKQAAGCFKALPELINSRKWNEVVREIKGISHILLESSSDTEEKSEKDKKSALLPEDVQKNLRNKFDTVKEICAANGSNIKFPPTANPTTSVPQSSKNLKTTRPITTTPPVSSVPSVRTIAKAPLAVSAVSSPSTRSAPSVPVARAAPLELPTPLSPLVSSVPSETPQPAPVSAPVVPSTPILTSVPPSVHSTPFTPCDPAREEVYTRAPIVEETLVKEAQNKETTQCRSASPGETPTSAAHSSRLERLQTLYSRAKNNLLLGDGVYHVPRSKRHPMDVAWKTGSKYLKRVLADYPDKEDEESCPALNIDFYMKDGIHPLAWAYSEGMKINDEELKRKKEERCDVPDSIPSIRKAQIVSDNFQALSSEKELREEKQSNFPIKYKSDSSEDLQEIKANTIKEMAKACDFSAPKISTIDYDGYANRVSTLKRVFEGLTKKNENGRKIPRFQVNHSNSPSITSTSSVNLTYLSQKTQNSIASTSCIDDSLINPIKLPSVASVSSKFEELTEKDDDYGSFSRVQYEGNRVHEVLLNKQKPLLQYRKEDLRYAIEQVQGKLSKIDNEHPAKRHMYEALSSLYAAIAKLEIAGEKAESDESIAGAGDLCSECGKKKKLTDSLWYDNEKLLDKKFESYLHLCCQSH
ncbi:DgyrCDS6214 [Dimorphilus gyrociliatus]|uniref:DgyrCDS6214 n=1 Tax=Dimorphilus gyrociliatus TaxID=2664684 RepID=A0A7I8VMG0_9ANNE|nr:DgyrCDS6214 [Dimorphilus gyrociliatus]